MQKIIIQKQKEKLIPDGTFAVEAFQASDGKIFEGWYAESKCEAYEKLLSYKPILDKVKKKDTYIEYTSFPTEWYFAGTEDEMEAICYLLQINTKLYHCSWYTHDGLKATLGNWIGVITESNDNGKDDMYIFTWEYVEKQIKEYVSSFEKE